MADEDEKAALTINIFLNCSHDGNSLDGSVPFARKLSSGRRPIWLIGDLSLGLPSANQIVFVTL